MSGGIIFDLGALAGAMVCAGAGMLIHEIDLRRKGHRPFDWQKDAPEFRIAKDAHVRRLP